jgi:hypothetical protein
MRAVDLIAKRLLEAGVQRAFGIPGGEMSSVSSGAPLARRSGPTARPAALMGRASA